MGREDALRGRIRHRLSAFGLKPSDVSCVAVPDTHYHATDSPEGGCYVSFNVARLANQPQSRYDVNMIPNIPAKAIFTLIGIVGLCLVLLSFCMARKDAKEAIDRAQIANATGKALDTVAKETPVIRAEQEEKERAVDQIQGSDTKLPDGFGRDLQRVRDGQRRNP